MFQILKCRNSKEFSMNYNEDQEVREYEKRIQNLKSRDYTQEELEDWKSWAESWVDTE